MDLRIARISAGAMLVLGLMGCSEASGQQAGEAISPEGSPTEVAARAEQIFASFAGTADQRNALEVVVAYGMNGAFGDCLADRGYEQPWQDMIGTPAPRDALEASIWGGDPDFVKGYFSAPKRGGAAGTRAGYKAEIPTSNAQGQAQNECREGNDALGDDAIEALYEPEGYAALNKAWEKITAEAGTSVAPQSEYMACLKADLPAALGVSDWDEVGRQIDSELDPNTVPLSSEDPVSREWSDLLRAEDQYAAVDWNCRRDNYDATMNALQPKIEEFASEHADELAELADYWANIAEEASGHGWHAGTPQEWDLPLIPETDKN